MAHPYKSSAHRNDPKWLGALHRATGGGAMYDTKPGSGMFPDQSEKGYWDDVDRQTRQDTFSPDPTTGDKMSVPTDSDRYELDTVNKRMDPVRKRGGRVNKRADGGDVPPLKISDFGPQFRRLEDSSKSPDTSRVTTPYDDPLSRRRPRIGDSSDFMKKGGRVRKLHG